MQPKISEKDVKTIGHAVRWYRTFRGLSQMDLAAESEVSQNVICRLENEKNVTLDKLLKLCKALNVPLSELAAMARV